MANDRCKEKIDYFEKVWRSSKKQLQECRSALKQTENELSELIYEQRKKLACLEELEEARRQISYLESKIEELEQFKRYVTHPYNWIENVSDPLAKRLQEHSDLLGLSVGKKGLSLKNPERLVRKWAHRLYKLVGDELEDRAMQEFEVYLIALWYWLRFKEVAARFEE